MIPFEKNKHTGCRKINSSFSIFKLKEGRLYIDPKYILKKNHTYKNTNTLPHIHIHTQTHITE